MANEIVHGRGVPVGRCKAREGRPIASVRLHHAPNQWGVKCSSPKFLSPRLAFRALVAIAN